VDNKPEQNDFPVDPGLTGRANNYFLLIYAFACYLMAASIAGILYLGGNIILSVIVPGIAGYFLPLLVLTKRFRLGFAGQFKLHRPEPAVLTLVLLIAAAAIYPVDAVTWLFQRGMSADSDYISILLAFKPKGAMGFLAMALGMVVVTSAGEELLFRGLVQSVFHRNMGAALAILLSGLVFGVSHGTLLIIPGATVLGILLAFVFHRTGNLFYPMIIHAALNLVSLIKLHLASEETITGSGWSAPEPLWALVSAAALAVLLFALVRQTVRE
jgi:membrane protease YdiL (CAAX protease family)